MKILLLSGLAVMGALLSGCESVAVVGHRPVHHGYAYHGRGYYDGPRYYDDRRYYGSRSGYYHSRPSHRSVYASNTNIHRTNVSRTNVNVYKKKTVAPSQRQHVKYKKRRHDRD